MLDFYQRLVRKGRVILSGVLFFSFALFVAPAGADTPIVIGENLTATIDTVGEIDRYTFEAEAGDTLYVLMSTTSGLDPYFRLYAPNGSMVASKAAYSPDDAEMDTNPLPASGTYVLLAEDYGFNDTGEYRIFVQRRNNPHKNTPIGFGENFSAAIDGAGEVDTYTFNALAGDNLYVVMSTTSGLDPYFRVYAPDGSLIASNAAYSPNDSELDINSLPASGTYVLLAIDYGFNDTGEYRIFVQRRNNPQITTPIGFGENLSAAIDGAGEVDTYTFDALAGDNLYVVMSTTSGLDPYFRVYAPDGSLIASNAAYSPNDSELDINSLPASGTYVLLATDYDFNDTGEYRIFIQRRNNPLVTTPLRFGANLSATVDGVGEVDTYTFDTIEGDVVMVRMTTSSKLDPYFRLYAPDGSLITYKAAYNPGAAEFTSSPLSANGTYVMIAEDYGFDEIGAYNIQLVRIIGTENSLYVTPSQGLSSSGIEGGPFTAANITYTLKNVGSNPIDWNLTKGEDWLDLSKTGGSLAAGATDTVTIAVNTQANTLAANAYFDTLTFTNTTENNLEIFRNVTLLVKTPEGSLVVTPDDVFLSTGPRHGPFLPATMTFTLTNVGDAIMNWKVAKTAHWLNLSAAQGALNSGGTVDIRVDINEAPNDFAWGLYKDRISFINITNGNGDTLRDVELTIEAIPSEITCELSASNLVLGEPLSVSGQITPQPNQSGAFVGITLIAPDASEVHRSVVANALGQFSYAVACDDIHQAGTWTVRTSWSGDEGLYPATSGDQILELSKAESRLTINSTSQALKLDVPVDISGKFTPQPDCGGDLAGRAIELHISGPGGISRTESVVTGNRWGHYVLQDYIGFDALGDWTVEAVFAGDGAYAPSSSELLNVKVVETAGYAVVVQGKISSNEGLASHNKTANFVYDQLIARGLMNDDIMYFNYDDGQPGVDGVPDKSGIQDAITQWAQDKMNVKPANLYLVMVDHGFDDTFYIHPDIITAPELKEWLNTLQEGLIPEAKIQEKIIILGFCRSGSFIDDLSGSYRAVIASAAADESSYKGPLDADGIREGEYFVSEFFKAIAYGKSIAQSFNEAAILTESFTVATDGLSPNAPYYDGALQHPLLDDNGDGLGSNDLSDPAGDGGLSENLFIGVNTITTNDPEDVSITSVAPTAFLNANQASTNFWARVDNNTRLDTLWIEIKPAGFSPVGQGGSEQIEMDLTRHVFDTYNPGLDRYEWPDLSGFSNPGTYQVFYFAKDSQSANVSPLMQTTVYKAKATNQPPPQVALLAPAAGAVELTSVVFDWEDTGDPEDDAFTYTLLLSKGDDTFSNPIRKEGLLYSACLLTIEDGLEDLSTYYWKVRAIDAYGAHQDSEVRLFHTNNTNPVACWINGHVYDTSTGQPIVGATVNVGGSVMNTAAGGYYLGVIAPGSYTLTAAAGGYESISYPGVSLPDGGLLSKDFGLVPQDGDADGDGILNTVENASSCLDPVDADTDDDGLADGTEDKNQNGVIDEGETDPCDPDSDGDDILDGTEVGVTAPVIDPDGSGPLLGTKGSVFIADSDPGSTTDPLDEDSDNDGQTDGQEDKNLNGRVDPGESDPNQSNMKAMPWIHLLLVE